VNLSFISSLKKKKKQSTPKKHLFAYMGIWVPTHSEVLSFTECWIRQFFSQIIWLDLWGGDAVNLTTDRISAVCCGVTGGLSNTASTQGSQQQKGLKP